MNGRPKLDLCTCSYARAPKLAGDDGVIVSTSVGQPKWLPGIEQARALSPIGLLHLTLSPDEFRARYRANLDSHAERVWEQLSEISKRHPGKRLVLCCYEDVHKPGDWCHRTMMAEWLEEQGYECPELTKPPPPPPPTLFDADPPKATARRNDPDDDRE